mgnify:CR=1 FL=1
MKYYSTVPTYDDSGLSRYLAEINKIPVLQPDEEYRLAQNYNKFNDIEAAHKLVSSHLRLVAKIAMRYRGYGLPIGEIISEGNIGLMQAVKKFTPEKGFRLATYAIWWIKASIQEYVLRSWSLVKIGTTTNQKKLFFNLRKLKNNISKFDNNDLNGGQVNYIAQRLNVSNAEVVSMNQRMSGDASLNTPIKSSEGEMGQWQDLLPDQAKNQEEQLIDKNEKSFYKKLFKDALSGLSAREANIFKARRLSEKPKTLEELAGEYDISRERIRQIELKAYEKVQEYVKTRSLKLLSA